MLYPLKFQPIYKQKIWGGTNLSLILNKTDIITQNIGESWEISCVENNISIVENGFLIEKNLQEIIDFYKADILGTKVFQKYGNNFPLLIKFIDANFDLSVQVHPNDEIAKNKHNSSGKSEMWYVLHSEQNSKLISGFNKETTKAEVAQNIENNTISSILNFENVTQGDVFYIPAGRVHAILKGILLAEIQQTSDITYRLFDWNRTDDNGNPRDLHIADSLEALDFSKVDNYKTKYYSAENISNKIIDTPFFSTNILRFNTEIKKDYSNFDTFIIYICTKGCFEIFYNKTEYVSLKFGECVLIPANLKHITLKTNELSEILEVFIDS